MTGSRLLLAAWKGEAEAVKEILDAAQDDQAKKRLVAHKNEHGWTPLHYGAAYEFVDIIKLLLAAGADPEAENHKGWRPLHYACGYGKITAANLLREAGASLESTNKKGWTCVHRASYWGRPEAVEYVLSNGGKTDTVDNEGKKPVDVANPAVRHLIEDVMTKRGEKFERVEESQADIQPTS